MMIFYIIYIFMKYLHKIFSLFSETNSSISHERKSAGKQKDFPALLSVGEVLVCLCRGHE